MHHTMDDLLALFILPERTFSLLMLLLIYSYTLDFFTFGAIWAAVS